MYKKFILILLLLVISFAPSRVFAQEITLPQQKVYPGTFFFPLKRLVEKTWEKFLSKKGEVKFYNQLVITRLSELNYIASNKKIGEVQTSSERFNFYAGKLTEKAKGNSGADEKRKIISDFENDTKLLMKLRDNFEYESSYWILIQHSINSLNIYIGQLKS